MTQDYNSRKYIASIYRAIYIQFVYNLFYKVQFLKLIRIICLYILQILYFSLSYYNWFFFLFLIGILEHK